MTESQFDQREYTKAYHREHTKYRKLSLNVSRPEDMALMDWIDAQPEGTSAYLKRLARADMSQRDGSQP